MRQLIIRKPITLTLKIKNSELLRLSLFKNKTQHYSVKDIFLKSCWEIGLSENDKYILLTTHDLIGDYYNHKFKEKE
jgi:hypothetical protein